jgi:hypothetical protein
MLAGTTFDTETHTRIGKCDKALEPAINETVNKKKFGKRLTNPDLSIDITANVGLVVEGTYASSLSIRNPTKVCHP